jgi:phosphatidylglycerol:prolipoprotein diacylglycerol transferase
MVLYAPLGITIGRLGCLVTADGDYGTATTLPWGMTFKYGYYPTDIPVHPTPVYEMLVMIPLFILLKTRVFDRMADGWTLAIYLAVYAIERFLIELIRFNRIIAFGLTLAQWLCILYLVVAVAIAARLLGQRQAGVGISTETGPATGS